VAWMQPRGWAMGGCPVHWMSKKQSMTADAVSDAEIVASHLAFKEGIWPLYTILALLGVDEYSVELLVDNTTAEGHATKGPSDTVALKLKALDTKAGYMHDMHENGMFVCGHVGSTLNRADLGTKSPNTAVEQMWWRSRVNLQLPRGAEAAARELAWRATNGPPPPKALLKGEYTPDGALRTVEE
jgi:hypothetical protein